MTVNVTKPAINVREKLAELDKPTGIAGEAMLRAETPQEQFQLIGAGRRNLIINGGFDVWQRGTSFSSPSIYTADRWLFNSSGTTLAVGKTSHQGLGNVLTSSSNTTSNLQGQLIENGGKYLYNKPCTLSFWVKADDACSANLRLRNNTTATNLEDDSYNVTTDWTYVTHTFSAYTGWSDTDVARVYLVNNTSVPTKIYFAQVQLELGSVATPFEHRSYGEELALCQRYYWQFGGEGGGQFFGIGQAYSTTQFNGVTVPFPVTMRDAPAMSYASVSNFRVQNSTGSGLTTTSLSISSGEASVSTANIRGAVSSGLVAGNSTLLHAANTSAILKFDAEL